ncbi:MAG: hypothetical protein Ta2D_01190 [Rickettsiales bacterium]|nr:MAG: hypothetical protein Ta2D_01190 [Rickettsiales bacterium]
MVYPIKELNKPNVLEFLRSNGIDELTEKSKLSDEKKFVIDYIVSHPNENIFVSGGAGTGKSLLIKTLIEIFKENDILSVSATTNYAAQNIDSNVKICYNVFGIGNEVGSLSMEFDDTEIKAKTDFLIDECSFLSMYSLAAINKRLQQTFNSDKPFGGKRMILFGDLLQLETATHITDTNDINFYNDESYISANFKNFFLDSNFRQERAEDMELLHSIRNGSILFDRERQQTLYSLEDNEVHDAIILVSDLNMLNDYDTKFLRKNPNKLYKNCVVIPELYKANYKNDLAFKVGSPIMFIKKIKEYNIKNGNFGLITNVFKRVDGQILPINEDDSIESLELVVEAEIEDKEGKRIVLIDKVAVDDKCPIKQFPFRLGYALMIHKSQGLQFDYGVIDCRDININNQFYVALSRFKNFSRVKLLNFNMNCIKYDRIIQYAMKTLYDAGHFIKGKVDASTLKIFMLPSQTKHCFERLNSLLFFNNVNEEKIIPFVEEYIKNN